ncbi:DUF6174 domain-containing protein [Nostoc sp. UHCC 0302]|uniref:DUF6174 domain-containing protein n=1 Tax=Nostoc sp. UHCC 0302 TaxID=3134896 RepID=UPI00311CCE09
MRLPLAISAMLVASLGLNTPVMSQTSIYVSQTRAIASSNVGKFRINRRLWNRQNISNYRYTFQRNCNCLPKATAPVVIEVRNGVTTSITYADSGQPADIELFRKYNTIPKLFNIIKDAIARKAYNLTVKYDPTLGYPTQINIDYDSQIADDEVFLTIENLQNIRH